MSVQTLYTAATGMDAMQTKLDVIANNLANINTTAFKRDRANFEDLLYRNEIFPGILDAQQNPTPTGLEIGLGARVQSTQSDFRQGLYRTLDAAWISLSKVPVLSKLPILLLKHFSTRGPVTSISMPMANW